MTTKKTFGNRKFYSVPEEYPLRVPKVRSSHASKKTEETSKLIKYIDENVIGRNHTFTGPYGRRKDGAALDADIEANTGRELTFAEEQFIRGGPTPNADYSQLEMEAANTGRELTFAEEQFIRGGPTPNADYSQLEMEAVVYCDYTASGRSLQFIEDYILREVLPCYGNTHTTTSITSMQSTLFRHEARDIVRNAVHASEHDAVIFAGSGCTGAVHKLIHALDLPEPPVVFMGPYEHHSNLLPWRELGAKIVRIAETREGFLDLLDLERQLQAYQVLGRQLIGCFSAASNITGILADDVATTLLLHQYGALAFWDYAAAAPCVKLDMNPILPGVDQTSVHKDAMFFSMHKFVGGVQTPGVLVAKKALFRNDAPNGCGGGTVFFVTRDSHRYLQRESSLLSPCSSISPVSPVSPVFLPCCDEDTELREEGGTAAVVESVRAGLVMQLKETVGVLAIMQREQKIARMVLAHVRTIPELILLGSGSQSVRRLPIFSFLVRHPRGTFLHHNFVCAVLNDVFGIQARGGCACAGPYAQDLLGIDEELALQYESVLLEDSGLEYTLRTSLNTWGGLRRRLDRTHLRRHEEHSNFEMLRPGFARVSVPFFMSDAEVAFVLEALKMVATEAWKLLPQYILNPETGEWRHHTNSVFRDRKWLGHIRYVDGKMTVNERRVSGCGTFPQDHADCLQTARNIFNKARKMAQRYPLADQCVMFDARTERLRWFMLPSEAQDLLLGNSHNVKHDVPFQPAHYAGSRGSVSDGLDTVAEAGPEPPAVSSPSPAPSPLPPALASPNGYVFPPHPHRLTSPRHSSLPCIDKHFPAGLLPCSDSCDGAFAASLPPPLQQPVQLMRPLHFAVGEAVTPQPLLTSPLARSPVHGPLAGGEGGGGARTRCHSLGSSSQMSPPPVLSPVTLTSLGLVMPGAGRRSCSSQTDLPSLEGARAASTSPMSSLGLLQLVTASYTDCSSLGQSSPTIASAVAPSQSPEDLQAYVKEVTKELATEIKSEIRGVISRVEDVLSDSAEGPHPNGYEKTRSNSGSSGGGESCNVNGNGTCASSGSSRCPPGSSTSNGPSGGGGGGPVSALEVAEYLMGMSREMASEMKSEIREMVSAVDCLISPDHSQVQYQHYHPPRSPRTPRSPQSPPSAAATSPDPSSAPDLSFSGPASGSYICSKVADLAGERTQSSECSSDETVIHVFAAAATAPGTPGTPAAATAPGLLGAGGIGSGRSEEEDGDEEGDGWEDDGACGTGPGGKQALHIRSTINSVSSQDSGINLTFHESDSSPGSTLAKDSGGGSRRRKMNLSAGGSGGGTVGSLQQLSRAALEAGPQQRRCDAGSCFLSRDELAERAAALVPADADPEAGSAVCDAAGSAQSSAARWHCPPKAIWKPAVEALQEFDMIRDGDQVMVCLSGGKDSLSLLHTLHQYQFYARAKGIHFTLGAATVDPGSTAYDPRPLIPYMASLGVHYLYEEQSILQQAASLDKCTSVCSFCSRMKRGRLYAAARKHGYNVLALGQHLDDLTESFLMSVFHNGRLRSMKAHYYIRERDLRVIRPFVYVREKALRQFAESRKLPIIPENCPACFEAPKERHRSKQLLAQQEILFPRLFWSLRSALHPLISFRYTGEESRTYMRHRKHSQSHGTAPPDADDSSDTDEEPVA